MEDSNHHHKLLVVDADPAILYLCSQCLTTSRVSVALASNVHEARQILAQDDFDLLITDFHLQGLTALDLVLGLRKEGNLTPVILMSGTPSASNAFWPAGISQWEFLDKPFDPEKFQNLARKLMCDELCCRQSPEKNANLL